MRASTCLVAFLASMLLVGPRPVASQPDLTLTGRLATVEPAIRRITLLAEGEVNLAELFVADDAEISEGERRLTLPELVILVGRRVTAGYQEASGRRLVRRLTVEPEQ